MTGLSFTVLSPYNTINQPISPPRFLSSANVVSNDCIFPGSLLEMQIDAEAKIRLSDSLTKNMLNNVSFFSKHF